jgi:hypothetical protein
LHDPAVAYDTAAGIINRQEVPEDLLEHLARALASPLDAAGRQC